MKNKKYIDSLGVDFTDYIKTDENIKDFEKLCECQDNSHKPLKECVQHVVEAINLSAKLKGQPKRAFIQAGPEYN